MCASAKHQPTDHPSAASHAPIGRRTPLVANKGRGRFSHVDKVERGEERASRLPFRATQKQGLGSAVRCGAVRPME